LARIEVGKAYRFIPSAFSGEKTGQVGGHAVPRAVTGRIVWIHRRHRFFLVEVTIHDHFLLRECFKF